MSTSAVRTLSSVAALAVATSLLIASPASARPVSDFHASQAKRGLECATGVAGVLPGNQVVERVTQNRAVLAEATTTHALPFRPSAMSFFGAKKIAGGALDTFLMLDPKGSPRVVTLKILNSTDTMTFTTKRMLNKHFPARLYAGPGGFHVFTVSKAGVLKRWTTYRTPAGRLYFGSPVTVRSGLKGLNTLAFHSRVKIGGKKTDLLYATTKTGALQQLRVPVAAPTKSKVVTIKRKGFKTTTGLSLSFCNNNANYLSLIAINAKSDSARWYTMAKATTPRAKNLVARGPLPTDVSWRLRSTI